MKHIHTYIGLLILACAIGFTLWIYRLEPSALLDPNDNTFQYALVERTNKVWDFAVKECAKHIDRTNLFTPRSLIAAAAFGFCHMSFLVDHWVPNWAEGYNLPYYYSHIPQIAIVGSYRFLHSILQLFNSPILSLFQYYHWITYLLLSLFPLSVFLATLVIGLSPLTAGASALVAAHLSTNGLYGLDPASFLWRGYGLSSQLFSMIWLPLALAYAWKYFNINSKSKYLNSKQFSNIKSSNLNTFRMDLGLRISPALPAVFALAATTAGHLGIGIIAFLSVAIVAISKPIIILLESANAPGRLRGQAIFSIIWTNCKSLLLLYGGVFLLLGYWIFPILMHGNYHNNSVWDPIWKFDSYGAIEVLKNLFNGDLFDFGRFPTLTIMVFIGFFATFFLSASSHVAEKEKIPASATLPTTYSLIPFAVLFLFWLLMYFGRTTWGGFIDLIPGMKDFHLSRFIVGVHIAGLFLIAIGFEWIAKQVSRSTYYVLGKRNSATIPNTNPIMRLFVYSLICLFVYLLISPQTIRYSSHNDVLINQANKNFRTSESDISSLLSTLNSLIATRPGRVFAGRGGMWGKNIQIAETPYYMYLSTYGIPTVLWLPETWSPNSDTEQYFRENNEADYRLYNIRYIVTPQDLPKDQIQPFWKPLAASQSWKLYGIGGDISNTDTESGGGSQTATGDDNSFGYITSGIRPAIVSSSKEHFTNVVRLWIQSDFPKKGLFPELTFDASYPKTTGLPNFRMTDEVTYTVPDGSRHALFAENPVYIAPQKSDAAYEKADIPKGNTPKESHVSSLKLPVVVSQSQESDMVYKATVDVAPDCAECIIVLKQTFHPSWTATVDGKSVKPFAVFPFFTAITLHTPGTHDVLFRYEPSGLKKILLAVALISLVFLIWLARPNALQKFKAWL